MTVPANRDNVPSGDAKKLPFQRTAALYETSAFDEASVVLVRLQEIEPDELDIGHSPVLCQVAQELTDEAGSTSVGSWSAIRRDVGSACWGCLGFDAPPKGRRWRSMVSLNVTKGGNMTTKSNKMFSCLGLRAIAVAAVPLVILLAHTMPARAVDTQAFSRVGLSAVAKTQAAPAMLNNVATRSCLESNESKQVYTNFCNGGNSYQQWALASGTTLQNVASGSCLESNDSKQVYTNYCNGSSYQKWSLGSGTTLRNLATGFCLDSNDNKQVYAYQCDGSLNEQWSGI
jgi:serine/threonine-protein kinase